MPLPKPTLDNRTFDQLVAEARAQIPRHAALWTDHNASDPGITLVELAAWLTEQNVYRFDRPSGEALRAFARLVGVEPRPPSVARTVVALSDPNGVGVALPERMQLASVVIENALEVATERFETTSTVFVSPAALTSVLAGRAALADMGAQNAALSPFDAFGARPRAGHCLYLGFDRALDAPGQTLALHVWTETWEGDAAVREALIAEYEAWLERTMLDCPCETWKGALHGAGWQRHYRVDTIWEYHAGGGVWLPLADVVDETRALSLTGFVRFTAPAAHVAGGPGPQFFIRCRIRRGRFECPPRIRHVALNAVVAEHAVTVPERALGLARGHAHSLFAFDREKPMPIVFGHTRVRLNDGVADDQPDWHEVLQWDRSGAHARDFRIDPERGSLQCGDGLRAVVFPAGFTVYASCRAGSGETGNIAQQTLTRVPANAANVALVPALAGFAKPLDAWQPFDALGGAPRETLRAAQARAYEMATRVDKAVTAADFERLALATPGIPIAKAHAVAGMHPALPCYPAPGAVTLIVVPRCPLPAPLPSRAFLDAVLAHLDPRRLTTSEIHAVAPDYRRVTVHATLHLGCDARADEVRARAIARIDAYFDPLTGGDGTGWPIGRTVYRSEIMAMLADLDGVARVTDFGLQAGCDTQPRCDNITLCPYELVVPGRHRLRIITQLPQQLTRSDAHECEPC